MAHTVIEMQAMTALIDLNKNVAALVDELRTANRLKAIEVIQSTPPTSEVNLTQTKKFLDFVRQ